MTKSRRVYFTTDDNTHEVTEWHGIPNEWNTEQVAQHFHEVYPKRKVVMVAPYRHCDRNNWHHSCRDHTTA